MNGRERYTSRPFSENGKNCVAWNFGTLELWKCGSNKKKINVFF
jgi:hypothetical protein